jgi:hypothetical protein
VADRAARTTPNCAQITQFGTQVRRLHQRRSADHIGGYRVMAAASGRHAARLVFQSASVLIADSARPETGRSLVR